MKNRKFLLIALALLLPIALIFPLRAMRSWQPRVLELARNTNVQFGFNNISDFYWRPNGLLLARFSSDAWAEPTSMNNWNGQSVTVRALRAQNASLDRQGTSAALIYDAPYQGEIPDGEILDLWNVRGERSDTVSANRVIKAREQEFPGFSSFVIAPDGTRVAWDKFAPRAQGAVGIADARTGQLVARVPHFAFETRSAKKTDLIFEVNALAFSPDSRQLAVVGMQETRIVNAQSGQLVRSWRIPSFKDTRALWSPDGKMLALAQGYRGYRTRINQAMLRVHDARSGQLVRSWSQTPRARYPLSGVTNLDFSPDSQSLAWGTHNGDALLMNLASGQIERHFQVPDAKIVMAPAQYVAFAPDGQTLAVAAPDKVTLWRVR